MRRGRQGWLPQFWVQQLSGSHFHAISFVFTVLLILEVIELVLSLPNSVTAAAGKQFEIMSLILIRQSFKELGDLSEPITWAGGGSEAVIKIFSDATGALLIFGLLGLFYKIQSGRHEAESTDLRMLSFVAFKKLVALALLLVLVVIGVVVIWDALSKGGGLVGCFRAFYSRLLHQFLYRLDFCRRPGGLGFAPLQQGLRFCLPLFRLHRGDGDDPAGLDGTAIHRRCDRSRHHALRPQPDVVR